MRKLTPEEIAALGLEVPAPVKLTTVKQDPPSGFGQSAPKPQRRLSPQEVEQLGLEHVTSFGQAGQGVLEDAAAFARGPAATVRRKEALQLPWFSTNDIPFLGLVDRAARGSKPSLFNLQAGREVDKLRAGTNELGYNLAGMVGSQWADKYGPVGAGTRVINTMQKKVEAVAADQAAKDSVFAEINDIGGFANIPKGLGAALPYLLSGFSLGKPAANVAERAIQTALDVPSSAVKAGKGMFSRSVERGTISPNIAIKNIASKAKTELTDPWASAALHNTNKVKVVIPYRDGVLGEIAGAGALGALEGGLHYDNTVAGGAVSSMLGSIPGIIARPILSKMPDYRANEPNSKELLKWGYEKGMRFLPGMESGSKRYQKFEHAMRADSTFADPIHAIDQANAAVTNRVASESMGLPATSNRVQFTPKELGGHLEALGKEYDKLEAGTVAHFTTTDKLSLRNHLTALTKDTTQQGKGIASDAADYLKQLDLNTPQRNPLTGRMQAMILQGSQYKELRRRLQSDINDSFANGNSYRANALLPILKTIDTAVENGILKKGGTTNVNQWRDLNERFAMTNLVAEHGLTPTGSFDPYKLLKHFEIGDIKRMVTGSANGKRVDDLHKLAQLEYMAKHQMGSDMSGMGVKNIFNSQNQGVVDKLLTSSWANSLDSLLPLGSLALGVYANHGWFNPVRNGWLNLSGKGFQNPALYTRAAHEGQQPAPKLLKKFNELKDKID